MKKALVVAMVMVLGLGAAVFADGALTGKWTGSTSLFPSAGAFADFIKSFSSVVQVDYTIGGWVFTGKSTFGVAGLTGMQFKANGVLGAFTFTNTVNFTPMLLTATSTTYTGGTYSTVTCGAFSGLGFAWTGKTVTNTYTAAFDNWTATGAVSIAGMQFTGLFFLQGTDPYASYTGGSFYFESTPVVAATATYTQTTSAVARAAGYGSGWKFSASGSFGDATLEALAYFNLYEYWYNDYMSGYAILHIADTFTKLGSDYEVVCNDCISRFSEFDLIVTGLSFGCTTVSAGVEFTCAGFEWAKVLIEDISLGCCWDLNFDFLITFSTLDKALSMEPDITIANSCFSFDIAVLGSTDEDNFTITGIDIRSISLSHTWNGITFSSATSFDLANHPILGSFGSGYISGPDKIYIWKPDTTFSTVTVDDDGLVTAATYAIDGAGKGYWTLGSYACERAYAYEKLAITVEGDACCGGAFKVSAATYFGDIKELKTLVGTYSADTSPWGGAYTDVVVNFYGAGTGVVPPAWTYGSATDCGACCDVYGAPTLEVVDIDYTYVAKAGNRLFNWIESDVDASIAIASNFTLKFGLDVNWYGWEDFTIGFEFTF